MIRKDQISRITQPADQIPFFLRQMTEESKMKKDLSNEDVQDLLSLAARKGAIHSKLFNADTLWRNDYIARFLKHCNCVRVLDTPCGRAPLLRITSNLCKKLRYLGIDLYQPSIEDALTLSTDVEADYNFLCYDVNNDLKQYLENNKYANNINDYFDAILCLEGPEHFEQEKILDIFKQFKEMLTPKGFLIVATPRLRNDNKLQHPHCHNWEKKIEDWLEIFKQLDFELFNYFGYRIKSVLDRLEDPDEEYYLEEILDKEDLIYWNNMTVNTKHQIPCTSHARLIPQFISLKQRYAHFAQNIIFVLRKV